MTQYKVRVFTTGAAWTGGMTYGFSVVKETSCTEDDVIYVKTIGEGSRLDSEGVARNKAKECIKKDKTKNSHNIRFPRTPRQKR